MQAEIVFLICQSEFELYLLSMRKLPSAYEREEDNTENSVTNQLTEFNALRQIVCASSNLT